MKKMNLILLLTSAILWFSCSTQDELETTVLTGNETMQKEYNGAFKYLALGDSYTIGQSVDESLRFPVQLVKKLNEAGKNTSPATIVARTGWTTDELVQGIKDANLSGTYDLVTLLIGVNNQYRGRDTAEYRAEFKELLQTAINFAEQSAEKVIVISIPDYGVTPYAENRNPAKIAEEIDIFNKINQSESILAGAFYVDITPISRRAKSDDSLIAPDKLHPSGEMYRLWVEEIFPKAKQILNNQ